MGDLTSGSSSFRTVATDSTSGMKKSTGRLIASSHKSCSHQSLQRIPFRNQLLSNENLGRVAGNPVASFLLKAAALEVVRRFSKARCPFVWSTLQALQVVCYPPFKWIERWNPFRALVKGMQMLSRPLLVISLATALSDGSGCKDDTLDNEDPPRTSESTSLDSPSDISSVQSAPCMSIGGDGSENLSSKTWLLLLYKELQLEGITLPERIDEEELHRFYETANGNFPRFLSLVKKTISWRKNYRILSEQELKMWSSMVFWHGVDKKHQLCLIVRLGLACMSVPLSDRPRFSQAVVSQVEYGVLHLMDNEHSRITVLVDCEGLSPLKFPMQMSLTCCNILQEHFPKRLGCIYVVRLPLVARVIAQTFIQFLKPGTRQKLKILGEMYQEALSSCIETLPSCLGGLCTCLTCSRLDICNRQQPCITESNWGESFANITSEEVLSALDPTYDADILLSASGEQLLRKAVVGILMFWVLIAFFAGVYGS
ncbi:unnamed protein product [Coffea canephora]|uniref:CRAL-TRIO domain-containing protein n=1 Tax=Coffea canephora TaxID=49390 RepID=A0A068UN26_COFCA|nr:unnamed protein product [Coffea canephora]